MLFWVIPALSRDPFCLTKLPASTYFTSKPQQGAPSGRRLTTDYGETPHQAAHEVSMRERPDPKGSATRSTSRRILHEPPRTRRVQRHTVPAGAFITNRDNQAQKKDSQGYPLLQILRISKFNHIDETHLFDIAVDHHK